MAERSSVGAKRQDIDLLYNKVAAKFSVALSRPFGPMHALRLQRRPYGPTAALPPYLLLFSFAEEARPKREALKRYALLLTLRPSKSFALVALGPTCSALTRRRRVSAAPSFAQPSAAANRS